MSPPSSRGLVFAAAGFGALVLSVPAVAHVFRGPLTRGGLLGLASLLLLSVVFLVLAVGCLVVMLRAHARATQPPDHDALAGRATDREAALMRAFQFDPDDLRANRSGVLSARQRRNLRAGRTGILAMGATMLGVTYLALTFMPLLVGTTTGGAGFVAPDTVGLWLGAGLVTVLIGASLLYTYRLVRHQLHLDLSVAEGIAGPLGHRGDGHPASRGVPTVPVGEVAVPVTDQAQREALVPGRGYRVYYVRAPIAIVLSIDPF